MMKSYRKLLRYTMYFDNTSNELVYLQSWDDNEIIYYDEFPVYNFSHIKIGYSLTDFLYLPFDEIICSLETLINSYYYDFSEINDFLISLLNSHAYFGFYVLKFHQFITEDDLDEIDCREILSIIKKNIIHCSNFCNNVVKNLLNDCVHSTLSYEQIYYKYIEKSRINRYFRTNEMLDYNFYYKTTLESIYDYNKKPLDQYSYYKECFHIYMKDNIKKLTTKYQEIQKNLFTEEDIIDLDFSYPYQNFEDEIAIKKGILPKSWFFQNVFSDYIHQNQKFLEDSYQKLIEDTNLKFVESVTIDEGMNVDISTCIIFELITMLKSHIKIKICSNCGKYFPVLGDYNTMYCERATNNLTCKVIANRSSTAQKIHQIPAMNIYMKYYKRYKGRVRIGKITEEDFDIWNCKSKKLRDECINGSISIDVFSKWLENYDKPQQ
ncbi:DUF6076 domain-containing protein [Lachnospiraceae bacterium 48-42]